MADIEQQLSAALRAAAVDAKEPVAGALIAAVRRRHRRRSVLLACVAVVVAIALAIPAVIIVRTVVANPAPATQQHRLKELQGLPMPAGTNLQFLVTARNGPAWYSTATQTETQVTGLSSLASAGFVEYGRVQGGTWAAAGCLNICGDTSYYFIADGSHTATLIGTGAQDLGAIASGHAGRVWLVSYPRGRLNLATESATVRLVSTSGQALGHQYQLPAGYLLWAAAGRYLLLRDFRTGSTGFSYVLWDPSARRVARNIDNLIAASQDWIAWTKGCQSCHLQLLNVATGKNVPTPVPAGPPSNWALNARWQNPAGIFTDNGQLLAYRTPAGVVDVYSVRSGLLMAIPAVDASDWEVAGWLNGGPELMVAAGWASGRNHLPPRPPTQVAIWRPGDTALRVATVKKKAEVYALYGFWVGGDAIRS